MLSYPAPEELGEVSGRITDTNRVGLPLATVAIDRMMGYSDAEGRYRIAMPAGADTVSFSFPGFATVKRRVSFERGRSTSIDIVLPAEPSIWNSLPQPLEKLIYNGCRCGNPTGPADLGEDGLLQPPTRR